MTFATALRTVRHARDWTQAQLAAEAGVNASHLCRIEKARVEASDRLRSQLLGALGYRYTEELERAARAARSRRRRT